MSYTKDQEAVVLKVLSYRPHQYYEILDVSRSSSDSEIKKSYRKLAIKLHPDKNSHPRASEAFKYLNKAWSVLGDEKKKAIFDQTGLDPDSRPTGFSSSASSSGGPQFANQAFENDIFNMFFGGGNAGPAFTFGNNGFTFQSFGGGGGGHPFFQQHPQQRRRAQQPRAQQQRQGTYLDTLQQLAPVLLFLLIPLLSALFSELSAPDYSFAKTSHFNVEKATPRHHIPFYVNENAMAKKNLSPSQQRNFELKVENMYIQDKRLKCSKEQIMKNELMEEAQGWFSVDHRKLAQAENMPMPNCQRLRQLNLI